MSLPVRQIDCNGCGAKVDIRTGLRMKTFVCEYCGSVCDGDKVVAVQKAADAREKYKPWSHLRLGMKAQLLGHEYQLVGRIRVKEKDWWWDEWFLMSSNGFPLFLQEDEGEFSIFRVYYPTKPVNPRELEEGDKIKLDKDGEKMKVREKGKAKLEFIEGELTWQAKPGEKFKYLDGRRDKQRFSIEWNRDEVQFLRGESRKAEKIYELFGIREKLPPAPDFD
ncbi:MAG: DUF4178 domain-containing protein [bacterium]